jgi:uncharacterized membrane protein
MSAFVQTLLIIHVVSGFTALVTGFLSMLNRKGDKKHRLTGKIFFCGMTGVFITAITLSVIRPNPFLFMVGFFSYYLACSGYRALSLKKLELQKPALLDWLIHGIGFSFGVGLMFFSLTWFQSRGAWGFVPFLFGILCLTTAIKELRSFYRPTHKLSRLISHGSQMGAAFAATFTAFIVVNFTLGSLTWMLWILPGVMIGAWIARNLRMLKQSTTKTVIKHPII